MNQVSLIGAPSGWGAGFRHTESGPPMLRALGLEDWLRQAGLPARWTEMVEPRHFWRDVPTPSRPEVFDLVAEHAGALARAVAAAMTRGDIPVVLGGDHAIAIGTWGGVSRSLGGRNLGLIWFDAHLDAHTVATTPSMNPHGMGAAVLLGHGEPAFLAVGGGAVRPENLCYVGARSYEEGELALLRRLGVRIVLAEEVRSRGLAAVIEEATRIATRGTSGFGLSIDLDGFEPADAPGVGLKEPNGLRRGEMLEAMAALGRHPGLQAIEIVEYIPDWDEDWRTARLVGDLLAAALGPAVAARRQRTSVQA